MRVHVNWWEILPVALLLTAFFAQTFLTLPLMSATSDEPIHLAAGYEYLHAGRISLNREHPPLMKQICALPLALFLHPTIDFSDPTFAGPDRDHFVFAQKFLYSNDANRLLFWARIPVICLGVLLGLIVYLWARDLFGRAAGLLALVLYAFCPNILAHSRFVTMDLGLSCFSIMSFFFLWKFWRTRHWKYLVAAGVSYGLALGAKYSAALFAPVLAVLLALSVALDKQDGRWNKCLRVGLAGGILFGLAGLIVWGLFYFPADPLFYWKGMKLVNANHNPNYPVYMHGQFKAGGWLIYFVYALLVKTPSPALIIFLVAVLAARRIRASHWTDELFIILPATFFFAVTSVMADNIGVRYVLPLFPFLFIFASRVAVWVSGCRKRAVLLASLCVLQAACIIHAFPDYIPYFGELVGGPAQGWKFLNDSNIDWGQDLPRLKKWMDRNGVEELRLLYPWSASPEYHGIKNTRVTPKEWHIRPEPALYAISIQHLVFGLWEAKEKNTKCDWLHRYQPVDRVGYSFYIYDFRPTPANAE